MRKFRVMVVFGTRPEAVKLAPVIRALELHGGIQPIVCVTAQHRQLLDQVLATFQIRPTYDLGLMRPDQDLADVTARALLKLRDVLRTASPDFVLVQGDTTTCLAAALASFYERVPVGHVEAGLRTWNLQAPFPEEANRAMVARLASLHFAPTTRAQSNLVREGVDSSRIRVTGNTVIDALHAAREMLAHCPPTRWMADLGEALSHSFSWTCRSDHGSSAREFRCRF